MSCDPAVFVRVAITWTVIGGVLLLCTGWLNRYFLRDAALRHLVWLLAFGGLLLIPLIHAAKASAAYCAGALLLVAVGLVAVWIPGTLFLLSRFVIALMRLRALRSWSPVFRSDLVDLLQLKNRCGVPGVEIRISQADDPEIPVTWGFWRPVVLLPKAAQDWTVERLTAVLLHEFGHVRRRDHLTQSIAFVVCAFHWFNPMFWRAARQMESEAEIAADDCAILAGIRPSVYATELLQLARQAHGRVREMNLVATSMAKPFTVQRRIEAIIDPRSARGRVGFWGILLVPGLALSLLLSAGLCVRALNPEPKVPGCLSNRVP